jgi:hypothetical protein
MRANLHDVFRFEARQVLGQVGSKPAKLLLGHICRADANLARFVDRERLCHVEDEVALGTLVRVPRCSTATAESPEGK